MPRDLRQTSESRAGCETDDSDCRCRRASADRPARPVKENREDANHRDSRSPEYESAYRQGLHQKSNRESVSQPSQLPGNFSGDQFREEILKPAFMEAKRTSRRLFVDLDGAAGYATSFLEAAFGGLAREEGPAVVAEMIDFKSDDEPYLIDEIRQYITEAGPEVLPENAHVVR
jgi:hypothetical protein